MDALDTMSVAVLIPCFNEEPTIARVIEEFRAQLPYAEIYVFDNNSNDNTAFEARRAGATVLRERRQGKGFVVQSMLRMVNADLYVMVDGDDTYPASAVRRLAIPVLEGEADMVVGSRLHTASHSHFARLNLVGNRLLLSTLNLAFGVRLTDILSGYRVFSRVFAKSVPVVGGGFEVEAELTIKALESGFRISEVPVDLIYRPAGSFSKLRPLQDGARILATILALFRDYRPLVFFGALAFAFCCLGLVPGTIVFVEYLNTGLVPKLPSAVLAMGLELIAVLLFLVGVVLHSVTRRVRELRYHLTCISTSVPLDSYEGAQKLP